MRSWGKRLSRPDPVPPSGATGLATPAAGGKATLYNIQGLRGIAALIVVMAHVSGPDGFEERVFGTSWTSWSNLPANTGVDLFFVISGLIMVVTTWRTFDAPGSSRRFLLRRIGRIYPLYWVVSSAVVVLFLVSPGSVSFDEGHTPSILQSYLLLPQEGRLPVLVAWSLVYEMYFYVVFAIALMLGRSRFPWVMGAWVLLTLTLSVVASGAPNPYVALVASPLSLEFVLGVLIGLAVVHGRFVQPRAVLAVGVLSYCACLVLLALSGWSVFPSEAVRVALVAIPAGLVVYGAIGVEVTRGRIVPSFAQRLGDASYSLYLTHVPALTLLALLLARYLPTTPWVHALTLPAVLLVVVCGALACYAVLERPLQFAARRVLQLPPRKGLPRALKEPSPDTPPRS
jgi:peptidoglycan/LPS O-acetylase OafA/YrhL